MKSFYIDTTYTEVLHNILVQHVKNPITLHNILVYGVLKEHIHNFYKTQQYITEHMN